MYTAGTTIACLQEYGRQSAPGGSKLLAQFADVDEVTVQTWFTGAHVPLGLKLVHVRCFLHIAGFTVDEFASLPFVAQRLALFIAMKYVTIDAVQAELEYRHRTGVLNILLRARTPLGDKAFRMQRIINRQDSGELDAAIMSLKADIELTKASHVPEAASSDPRQHDDSADTSLVRSSRVLMHMLFSLEEVIQGIAEPDRSEVQRLLRKRVSPGRVRFINDFLQEVIER